MSKPIVAILGAGSWGTAIAISAAQHESTVWLWDHDQQHCQNLVSERKNQRYLPNITFPDSLKINSDLADVLNLADIILIAVPSYIFRSLLIQIKSVAKKSLNIVWATKGIEPETGALMHQIIEEELGSEIPAAVLSGPTFAKEVAKNLPTAITLASNSEQLTRDVITVLHSPTFRLYSNNDMIGVEYGGSIKNVLAIATGIADGLGYSSNTRAALITRGLQEMIKIGSTLGGKSKTFMGLAGMGDLVLTCTDNQSRNRQFGMALAAGKTPEQAQNDIGQAIEGYRTTKEIYRLIQEHRLDTPIIDEIYHVLYRHKLPQEAVASLMQREPKAE